MDRQTGIIAFAFGLAALAYFLWTRRSQAAVPGGETQYVVPDLMTLFTPDGGVYNMPNNATPQPQAPVIGRWQASASGFQLVRNQEGGFQAKAYPDAGGYSIGYGHKITGADGLTPQSVITIAQAEQLLSQDIGFVLLAINSAVKVPLTQNQVDALTSLVYNIGTNAFLHGGPNGGPSTLLTKLNASDYAGAAQQFGAWIYSQGKVLPVLQQRRADEQALFTTLAA